MKDIDKNRVKKIINQVLAEKKPKTVKKLVNEVKELTQVTEENIYNIVRELENEKTIKLGFPQKLRELPETFREYLLRKNYFTFEFWIIFILTLIFIGLGFVSRSSSFIIIVKSIFGGLYLIIIPGWTITNLFFPLIYETIDQFERSLIAVGTSIGITIFSGLILNDIWIIESYAITITIGSFTIFLSVLVIVNRILIAKKRYKKIIERINLLLSKKSVRK